MKEFDENIFLHKKPTILDTIKIYKPYILWSIIFILLVWHMFNLIIGDKGILVLKDLREQEQTLQKDVRQYQIQNASLQKEIFEIVGK